jgi:hypothetical protein
MVRAIVKIEQEAAAALLPIAWGGALRWGEPMTLERLLAEIQRVAALLPEARATPPALDAERLKRAGRAHNARHDNGAYIDADCLVGVATEYERLTRLSASEEPKP